MATIITGQHQAAVWDLAAGALPKSPGLVIGGGDMSEDPRSVRPGIYGQSSYWAGMVKPRARLQVEATMDTKALLLHVIPTAYVPPALTALKVSVGTNAVNWVCGNCYLSSARLSGSPEEPLKCDFDFVGLTDVETAAGLTGVALGSELLPWGGAVVTVGGAAYEVENFEATIDNKCEHHGDVDTKAVGSQRLPSIVSVGFQDVGLNISCRKQIAWTLTADAPVVNIAAVITYTDGVTTITLTYTNLSFSGNRGLPLAQGGNKSLWTYPLIGKPGSLVIT